MTGERRPAARWRWHRQLKKPFFGRFMKPWRWPNGVPQEGWQRVADLPRDLRTIGYMTKIAR